MLEHQHWCRFVACHSIKLPVLPLFCPSFHCAHAHGADHERDEAAAGPSAPPPSEETASPGRDEVRAIPTAAKSGTPPPRAPSAGRRAHRGPVTSGGLQQERQVFNLYGMVVGCTLEKRQRCAW